MPPYSGYLRRLLIAMLAPLLALAAFNLFVDPYGEWGLLRSTQFSHRAAALGGRIGKAEAIHQNDWDLLLLGNSRVQMGLDPNHPAFKGLRVYNAGLYGADMAELERAARMAMAHPSLKRIILCPDLFSFDPNCPPVPDARQSLLNPNINPIDYRLANLLSVNATNQSMLTVDNARHNRIADSWPLGLFDVPANTPGHGRIDWVLGGYYQLIVPKSVRKSPDFLLSDRAFESLGRLLDEAGRRGIRVDVVQLPIHVMSLQRYDTEDRWSVYEQWLRRLTATVDEHNRRMPASAVPLWDFCEYSPLTTEPYPSPTEVITKMKWFWDPFHFKTALGDIVIDRLMGQPIPAQLDATGFGELITPDNIEANLAKLRADNAAYFAAHEDMREIRKEVRAARASGWDGD